MLRKLKFQKNISWPSIIDARARYRAVAQQLRNTALHLTISLWQHQLCSVAGWSICHNEPKYISPLAPNVNYSRCRVRCWKNQM